MKSVPLALAFLSLLAVLFLGGCAGTDKSANATDPNGTPTDSNGQPVSVMPWNKPTSWEQGGALGSMMQ